MRLSLIISIFSITFVSSCATLHRRDAFFTSTDEKHIGLCGNGSAQNAIQLSTAESLYAVVVNSLEGGTLIGPLFIPFPFAIEHWGRFSITVLAQKEIPIKEEEFSGWEIQIRDKSFRPEHVSVSTASGGTFETFTYTQSAKLEFAAQETLDMHEFTLKVPKSAEADHELEIHYVAGTRWSYHAFAPLFGKVNDSDCLSK